jgi:hypothetical protein
LFNDGSSTKLYECIVATSGGPFDPTKWNLIGGASDAADISYDNTTSGLNATNVQDAIDEVNAKVIPAATKTFYVDSNNPATGDGSVTNPFKTLDDCVNHIIGTGDRENPELVILGQTARIEVALGVYSTGSNLVINRVSINYADGADVTYTGSDYLYEYTDAVLGAPNAYQGFYVTGAAIYKLTNGGLCTIEKRNSTIYPRIVFFQHGFIYDTFITNDPTSRPVFQLDDGNSNANAYREQLVLDSLAEPYIDNVHFINVGTLGGVVWNGNNQIGRVGLGGDTNSLIRIVNSQGANIINIKNVALFGYGSQYYYEFGGSTRLLTLDGLKINAPSSGNPPSKFIHFKSDFDNIVYVATQNSTHSIENTSLIYDRFVDSEIITSSTVGDLESVFMNNNTFSGTLSSNIKVSKLVSFEANQLNAKPYTVSNIIEGETIVYNVKENINNTKTLQIDDEGVVSYTESSVLAVNTYFVNSNNTNSGIGSITNPFQSIDLAYNTIVGTGTPLNPELAPLGTQVNIIVQGGNYSTSNNILINRCSWDFNLGAVLDYTGIDALFALTSNVFPVNEFTTTYVLGSGRFTTSSGSIFRNDLGNLGNGALLELSFLRIDSNVVDSNNILHPVFDIDKAANTIAYNSCLMLKGNNKSIVFSSSQNIFKSGDKLANRGRVPYSVFDCFFILGSISSQSTINVDARIADIYRTQSSSFNDCWFLALKSDYLITVDGVTRSCVFNNCRFLTSGNSSAIKSKGILQVGDTFALDDDQGGSSSILSFQLIDCISDDKNFIDTNDLIVYEGTGDLETLYLNGCDLQGNPASNIKIAKSISFEGDGANPKPYVVINNFDGSLVISNPENNGSSVAGKKILVKDEITGSIEEVNPDFAGGLTSSDNGLSDDGTTVSLGGALKQTTTINGGGAAHGFNVGDFFDRVGYLQLNSANGFFASNTGDNPFFGFFDITSLSSPDGEAYGVFQALPKVSGDLCKVSFVAGSNTINGDHFGLPFEEGLGEIDILAYEGSNSNNRATVFRVYGTDANFSTLGVWGIVLDPLVARTLQQGFNINNVDGFEFFDSKLGFGLRYNNNSVDVANVVWGDPNFDNHIPCIKQIRDNISGATVISGESAGITGTLVGNTNYTASFTVTGAVVGDMVSCGFNDDFYDDLLSSGQDSTIRAKVTAPDTVEVLFRVESFLAENTNRKVWARIVK